MSAPTIPNPSTAADALSVSDGHNTVGYVIEQDGSYFSFDVNFVLLGEYRTQRMAMRAIPSTIAKLSKDQR
jgi:hypothetical protein